MSIEQDCAAEAGLLEVDVPGFSDGELAGQIGAFDAIESRAYAQQLLAVARLARRRCRAGELASPSGRGGPGVDARATADAVLAGVAEEFTAELALTRGCSEVQASVLLREAVLATTVLAPAWRALHAGRIGPAHVRVLVDLLGDAPPGVAGQVLARVLPKADGLTSAGLRERARYQLYRVDAEARERRRREALRTAGVWVRRVDEGLGELVVQGPLPAVYAAYDMVDGLSRLRREDQEAGTLAQLRAGTALDLLLRPWDTSRPAVTAQVVLHTSLRGDAPGELDGTVISAAECRDLLDQISDLDLLVSVDHPVTGETLAVATRRELERAARGPGLAPPPDTDAYEPTAAQQRHLRVRDRLCRMPGCRRRPGRARTDLDHGTPHADGGPTACWNLCCLCQRHHRIKTHAPGWAFTLHPDGTLEVRTPAGVTRTTRPPGWHPDPEPDPPWLDETAPPDPLRT